MSTRFAFLMGTLTGFLGGLILTAVGFGLLVAMLTPELTLKSLTTYRATVEMAQKPDEEKASLLAKFDGIAEGIRARRIGFLDSSQLTSELDPLVEDCRLSDAEWQKMVATVEKTSRSLGSD